MRSLRPPRHKLILSDDRDYFLRALESAQKHGLAWEFKQFYRIARQRGDTIRMATAYARTEWDL